MFYWGFRIVMYLNFIKYFLNLLLGWGGVGVRGINYLFICFLFKIMKNDHVNIENKNCLRSYLEKHIYFLNFGHRWLIHLEGWEKMSSKKRNKKQLKTLYPI